MNTNNVTVSKNDQACVRSFAFAGVKAALDGSNMAPGNETRNCFLATPVPPVTARSY